MSEKNYVIKYAAMDQLYLLVCNRVNGWYTDLNNWTEKYTKLVEMDSFQGAGAESVKVYLQEVHALLVGSIQQTLQLYQSQYLLYRNGYNRIDGNIYSCLPQEVLQKVGKKLSDESETIQEISDSIRGSLNSISDILYLNNPSIFTVKDTMDGVKKDLDKFDREIGDYESSALAGTQGDLQGLIDSLQTAILGYLIDGTNIASYRSGEVVRNTEMLDLYQRVLDSGKYIEEHRDEIELAAAEQEEAFAQMQADYEAACEAREQEGKMKMLQGGIAIVVGTLAIVGTAGMATPIVVTAAVSGGGAVLYGASTSIEGAQDWHLGSIGDLETASINPIRDTVFAGSQELYDMWGSLSMTVAGLCIPTGRAVNSAAGFGKEAMVKAAVKAITWESAKGAAVDWASQNITQYAAEQFNLNQFQAAILNIGLNIGLDQGADMAGRRMGVIDDPQSTDWMPYDDAKRYNQYWNELEQGIHNNHPGMSHPDLEAWALADLKVSEHIAISKVNWDEVIELRAKELDLQERFYHPRGVEANSNGATFMDGMSFEDAKRYNQWVTLREEGLNQEKINDIVLTNKGMRPDPAAYLSKNYIDDHLSLFNEGATIIMTEQQYERFVLGGDFIGIPNDGTQFVLPKSMCDEIDTEAEGDISYYEKVLGFDSGHFSGGGGLVRIDIENLEGLNLRIPSGNEYGANWHWVPGGFTDGGVPEAVTDLIPNNSANVHITQLES